MKKMSAEEVRRQWSYSKDPGPDHRTTEQWWQIRDDALAEFDDWLNQVKADAWDEALDGVEANKIETVDGDYLLGEWPTNPYRKEQEA